MADTNDVNGYTLNVPGRNPPWGDTEYQLFTDIVGKLPAKGLYLTDNHRHSELFDPSDDTATGTTMVEVVDGDSIKFSGGGLKRAHLNTTGLCIDMTGTFNVGNATEILDLRNTAANMYLKLYTGNTRTCGIKFGDTDDDDVGKLEYNHTTNTHTLTANATAAVSVTSTETNIKDNMTIVDAIGGNDVLTLQQGYQTFNKSLATIHPMTNADTYDFYTFAGNYNAALLLCVVYLNDGAGHTYLYSTFLSATAQPNGSTYDVTRISPATGGAFINYITYSLSGASVRVTTNAPAGWSFSFSHIAIDGNWTSH